MRRTETDYPPAVVSVISLDAATLVGRGLHRECYVHPANDSLCIKVIVAGNSDENRREASYYTRLAARGISWEMLARFHGLVATNLGEGAVFDLVRDYTGTISLPLAHYLENPLLRADSRTLLPDALPALSRYLLDNRVVTMTLKTKNILLQRTGEAQGRLVIVDNVGNSDFIPLSHYVAGLGRMKIRRKWRRFTEGLDEQYSEDEVLSAAFSYRA